MDNEYSELLARSGLSKAKLSRLLGVATSTAYHWDDSPPSYVIAYLRLLVERSEERPLGNEQLTALEDSLQAYTADTREQIKTLRRMLGRSGINQS